MRDAECDGCGRVREVERRRGRARADGSLVRGGEYCDACSGRLGLVLERGAGSDRTAGDAAPAPPLGFGEGI